MLIDDVIDWMMPKLMWLLIALVVFLIISAPFIIIHDKEAKERFFRECANDHKEYECTAMWRAGRRGTAFIPLVIPVR